jgi:hypothetical protein
MKNTIRALTLLLFMLSCAGLFSQEVIHERIEVIYQEILVRAFSGSKPVPGLKAGDFTLFENGRKVEIAHCRELRRSLASQPPPTAALPAEASRPRLFLFMLWFNEENAEWPKAWDYFCSHIFRAGDRVILSDGLQAQEIRSLDQDKEKIHLFLQAAAAAGQHKKLDKARLVSEMENSANDFYDGLVTGLVSPKLLLDEFKVRYQGSITEYRLARLKGYSRWLERLSVALKEVDAEKWVLVFMQNERLPLLTRDSRLVARAPNMIKRDLRNFMEESHRQISLSSDVIEYFRDLQPLFIGANATYHLFLSDAARETLFNDHLQWMPVFSSWEAAFRQISADTGGRVNDTNKLQDALAAAAASEDIYYVLTFLPAEGKDRQRVLKVEVQRPGLRVSFSRKLTLGEIFPLKISALEWKDGVLRIALNEFQRLYSDSGLRGRLRIGVQAKTKDGNPLAAELEVQPQEIAVTVEMNLNLPFPGIYRVQVEVEDLLSGIRARAERKIEIKPPAPPLTPAGALQEEPAELTAILETAANYCRRLKEGAFRFYCLEKVEEKILERNPLLRDVEPLKRRWHYDYQIIGAGGEIKEQRRLILDRTRPGDKPDASLETRFASRYSVFLPVTLLAAENRDLYRYRLVERVTLKKRRCAVVDIQPRHPDRGEIAQGRAWIDEKDGSVLKIEMNPRGVVGSRELEAAARRMSAELILETTHWYLVERQGLRFPSETVFVEKYRFDKGRQTRIRRDSEQARVIVLPMLETQVRTVEFYRLAQEYTRYRFFQVDSREEIKDLE